MKGLKIFLLVIIIIYIRANSFSQNFWEPLNTPDSTKIFCVEVNDSGFIFLGVANTLPGKGGVYRSVDHAINWERVGLENKSIYSLTIDNLGNIYAGANDGIYKSYSNGFLWTKIFTPTTGNFSNVLGITTGFDSIVLAGSWVNYAIMRSGDNGLTWKVVYVGDTLSWQYFSDFAFSNNGVIYACSSNPENGEQGIYSSIDYGLTWNYFGLNNDIISLSMDTNERLLAGALMNGLYRYDFANLQWSVLLSSVTVNDIVVTPTGHIYIAVGSFSLPYGGVMVSYDDGYSFNYINSGLFYPDMDDFTIDEQGHLLACEYAYGYIYRSSDPVITSIPTIENRDLVFFTNYPNPCSDYAFLNCFLNKKDCKDGEIFIYSSDSKLYLKIEGPISFPLKIDTSKLPNGFYYVVININGFVKSLKIIHI